MEKIVNSYETLFVIDADLTEEETKALVEKFQKLIADNGEISEVNEWGKRKLAYPINDKTEGYYVLINFKSESTLPLELERIFGITEGILRSIVIRHEDKKAAAKTEA
jgi:small subunit ribosomal protein S6